MKIDFFLLLNCFLGFIFYLFNLKNLNQYFLLSNKLFKKSIVLYITYILFFKSVIIQNQIFFLLIHLPNFILIFSYQIFCFWFKKNFLKNILSFLNKLIVQIQIGNNFRSCFLESTKKESSVFKIFLMKVYEIVVFSSSHSGFFESPETSKIIKEFKNIDQNSFDSLYRLKSLRDNLKKKFEFRLKTIQMTAQIQIQSYFLLLFYLASLIYVFWKQNWRDNMIWILFSMAFFSLGWLLMLLIMRKRSWKT